MIGREQDRLPPLAFGPMSSKPCSRPATRVLQAPAKFLLRGFSRSRLAFMALPKESCLDTKETRSICGSNLPPGNRTLALFLLRLISPGEEDTEMNGCVLFSIQGRKRRAVTVSEMLHAGGAALDVRQCCHRLLRLSCGGWCIPPPDRDVPPCTPTLQGTTINNRYQIHTPTNSSSTVV